VCAPDCDEVHHAAALDQDHVLAEQVRPDVGHVRLGEQAQEAELDVAARGEPAGVVVDGCRQVTGGGREVAQPHGTGGRRQADREVDQPVRLRPAGLRLQDSGEREYPPLFGGHQLSVTRQSVDVRWPAAYAFERSLKSFA
jgi:hypothetical protein